MSIIDELFLIGFKHIGDSNDDIGSHKPQKHKVFGVRVSDLKPHIFVSVQVHKILMVDTVVVNFGRKLIHWLP